MQSHRNCQISLDYTEVSISITFLTNEITTICHLTKSAGSLKNVRVDAPLNSRARLVELLNSGDRLGELVQLGQSIGGMVKLGQTRYLQI